MQDVLSLLRKQKMENKIVLKQKPMVSIVMPTYNRAHLIEKSIQSVLQQTYTNFELLIVDDGSIDNTEKVVQRCLDPRIRYIKCSKNMGANVVRNIGIKAAKCEYIAFQDSDDEWLPNKLEKQMILMEKSDEKLGVVYTGFWRFEGDDKSYTPSTRVTHVEGNISQEILKENFVSTQTILVKKKCLEDVGLFDEKLPRLQDWELIIRLSKKYEFQYVKEGLVNVYHTENSITSTGNNVLYDAYETIINKNALNFEDSKLLGRHYSSLGIWFIENDDFLKGRKYLFKAIKSDQFIGKYYLRFILAIFGERFYKKSLEKYKKLDIYKNLG